MIITTASPRTRNPYFRFLFLSITQGSFVCLFPFFPFSFQRRTAQTPYLHRTLFVSLHLPNTFFPSITVQHRMRK